MTIIWVYLRSAYKSVACPNIIMKSIGRFAVYVLTKTKNQYKDNLTFYYEALNLWNFWKDILKSIFSTQYRYVFDLVKFIWLCWHDRHHVAMMWLLDGICNLGKYFLYYWRSLDKTAEQFWVTRCFSLGSCSSTLTVCNMPWALSFSSKLGPILMTLGSSSTTLT